MNTRKLAVYSALLVSLALLGVLFFGAGVAHVEASAQASNSPVFWTWEGPGDSLGTSKLVRNGQGLSADLTTSALPAGQAMTLWFIVFNHPELCVGGPYACGPADLGVNRAAKGDFLLANGHVIGADGNATFGGHLNVGDLSGSGMWELPGTCVPGYEGCGGPPGLINPEGALVILAVHSHGPALSGKALESQLRSYLGGCTVVIGTLPGGFAAAPAEVPTTDGECSTIQISPHA